MPPSQFPSRSLRRIGAIPCSSIPARPDRLESGMFDLFYLTLGIGVFALFAAYVFGLRGV